MRTILSILFALFAISLLRAEGSKNLRQDYKDQYFVNYRPSTANPGEGFMGFNCPESEKLYIRVLETGEYIHLGFGNYFINQIASVSGSPNNSKELYYQLRDPSGVVVMKGAVPQLGKGYIGGGDKSAFQKCVAGPQSLNESGYNDLWVETLSSGDYVLEFNVGDSSEVNSEDFASFQLFDVSISSETDTASGARKLESGRVFSKAWNIGTGGKQVKSELQFYHTKPSSQNEELNYAGIIRLNSFRTDEVIIACHSGISEGKRNESTMFSSNGARLTPDFPLFLTSPDLRAFPMVSASQGVEFGVYQTPNGKDQGTFFITHQEAALARIHMELNGQNGYQEGSQDRLFYEYLDAPGVNAINFDGKSGAGVQLKNGKSVKTVISLRQNPVVISLYNVQNINGIAYKPLDKGTWEKNAFYKDPWKSDRIQYSPRSWDEVDGNGKTMITWFYAANEESVTSLRYGWEVDMDGDGIANFQDADADNDGISNRDEHQGVDPLLDDNGNGIPNYLDPAFYHPLYGAYQDKNRDGFNDVFDADLDSRPNFLDLDGNNDGYLDISAVGGVDKDGSGVVDLFVDTNRDGHCEGCISEVIIKDYDNDDIPDFLDEDSDGDGLSNYVELQDFMRFRQKKELDDQGNGIDNAFDRRNGGKPIAAPFDKNENNIPDYLEVERDGLLYNYDLCRAKVIFDRQESCVDAIPPFSCFELDLGPGDPEGKPLIFKWDLGDGSTKEGPQLKHCYDYYGNFNVSLTVVDGETGDVLQENELDMSVTVRDSMKLRINTPSEVETGEIFQFGYDFTPPIDYRIHDVYWSFGNVRYRCEPTGFQLMESEGEYDVKMIMVLRSEKEQVELCAIKKIRVK